MPKEKENVFKMLAILLGAGIAIYILTGLISFLLGWIVSLIFGWDWFICSVIIYALMNAIGDMDFEGEAKCTECKRKILTSRSIKCEVCGGPARLTKHEYKKVVKKKIYERKETSSSSE